MKRFNEVRERNIDKLGQFVPVVARVHGGSHPEFHDVKRVFDSLYEKINENSNGKPKLDDEFKELREITDNYTVPGDVCESYEAVYNMLAELDEAYTG